MRSKRPIRLLVALLAAQVAAYVLLGQLWSLPMWARAVLITTIAVTVAQLGMSAAQWLGRDRPTPGKDNELISGSLARVGALYALVLGFVVVAVWQAHKETDSIVGREANAVADLERMSHGFPVEVQRQVQEAARTYVWLVVNEEWKEMSEQRASERAQAALVELWDVYTDMESKQRESPLYVKSVERLNQLGDNRRARLKASSAEVPDVMWLLLFTGAAATVVMSYTYVANSPTLQRTSVGFQAGMLAFVLFLTAALEQPFDDFLTVKPDAFVQVLHNMRQLET